MYWIWFEYFWTHIYLFVWRLSVWYTNFVSAVKSSNDARNSMKLQIWNALWNNLVLIRFTVYCPAGGAAVEYFARCALYLFPRFYGNITVPNLICKMLIMKYYIHSVLVLITQKWSFYAVLFAINILGISKYILCRNSLNFIYNDINLNIYMFVKLWPVTPY